MITRYRVSMDNIDLHHVDERIVILDIEYPESQDSYAIETPGKRNGGQIARHYVGKTGVRVSFMLRVYNTEERQNVWQKIKSWAKSGHVLRCNDRSRQCLRHVMVDKFGVFTAKNWLETLTIEFADYVFPFWEDDFETTLSLEAGTDKSGTITLDGNADETFLNATITAAASVSWIKVIAGDTMIHLTGLSLSSSDAVVIDYDDDMNLRIMKGTTSLLDKRTAASSDDLIAKIGEATAITVQASGNVSSVIKGRGCWL